jgi:endonuclease/exonuclease/phosphatase family metal-dependent hydrolase
MLLSCADLSIGSNFYIIVLEDDSTIGGFVIEFLVKSIVSITIGFIFTAAVFMSIVMVADYRPKDVEAADMESLSDRVLKAGEDFSVTTYNIGYCGLDKGRDFFMDGGKNSKSESREKTLGNLEFVASFLKASDSDIYTLQEVDWKSSRSFDVNQVDHLRGIFSKKSYDSSFAFNYKSIWVPVPALNPMGYANSGILTMSRFRAKSATRIALPFKEPFPKSYFDLKRCVLENEIEVEGGKRLYIMNIHLSAFDKGGAIKARQIDFLIERIGQIMKDANNYVIISGDWNHILSDAFPESGRGTLPGWVGVLPDKMLQNGFKVVCDNGVSTVRSTDTPYEKGRNFEAVIDGFVVSGNIEVVGVAGSDLGFSHTDHNPVTAVFKLK